MQKPDILKLKRQANNKCGISQRVLAGKFNVSLSTMLVLYIEKKMPKVTEKQLLKQKNAFPVSDLEF